MAVDKIKLGNELVDSLRLGTMELLAGGAADVQTYVVEIGALMTEAVAQGDELAQRSLLNSLEVLAAKHEVRVVSAQWHAVRNVVQAVMRAAIGALGAVA